MLVEIKEFKKCQWCLYPPYSSIYCSIPEVTLWMKLIYAAAILRHVYGYHLIMILVIYNMFYFLLYCSILPISLEGSSLWLNLTNIFQIFIGNNVHRQIILLNSIFLLMNHIHFHSNSLNLLISVVQAICSTIHLLIFDLQWS